MQAVLGQQVTVKAAGTLAGRIVERYGSPVETGIDGLTNVFPCAGDVASVAQLRHGEPVELTFEARLGKV